MTSNQVKWQEHLENVRHNMAAEQENVRHNVVSEEVGISQANAAAAQANAAQTNAATNQLNALTNQRAQDLAEEKWRDPFGGTQMGEFLKNAGTIGKWITAGVRLINAID